VRFDETGENFQIRGHIVTVDQCRDIAVDFRDKASIVNIKYGKGKVVLLGFRVQHRAQPHGTFKLLFNSIHYGGINTANTH